MEKVFLSILALCGTLKGMQEASKRSLPNNQESEPKRLRLTTSQEDTFIAANTENNNQVSSQTSSAYSLFLMQENTKDKQVQDYTCRSCSTSFTSLDDFKEHYSLMHEEETDSVSDNAMEEPEVDHDMNCQNKASLPPEDNPIVSNVEESTDDSSSTASFSQKNKLKLSICNYPQCNKAFTCLSKLAQHKRMHAEKKPYICDVCDKSFARSFQIKQHRRTHTGERPYICNHPGCDKTYTSSSGLMQHKRKHTRNESYACLDMHPPAPTPVVSIKLRFKGILSAQPEVSKSESLKDSLEIHAHGTINVASEKSHQKDTTLPDTIVNKKATKPYKCDYSECGKSFSTAQQLQDHKNAHIKKMAYICKECKRSFAQKKQLYIHKETHLQGTEKSKG